MNLNKSLAETLSKTIRETFDQTLGETFRAREASPQSLGSDYMLVSPQDSLRDSFFHAGCDFCTFYSTLMRCTGNVRRNRSVSELPNQSRN